MSHYATEYKAARTLSHRDASCSLVLKSLQGMQFLQTSLSARIVRWRAGSSSYHVAGWIRLLPRSRRQSENKKATWLLTCYGRCIQSSVRQVDVICAYVMARDVHFAILDIQGILDFLPGSKRRDLLLFLLLGVSFGVSLPFYDMCALMER